MTNIQPDGSHGIFSYFKGTIDSAQQKVGDTINSLVSSVTEKIANLNPSKIVEDGQFVEGEGFELVNIPNKEELFLHRDLIADLRKEIKKDKELLTKYEDELMDIKSKELLDLGNKFINLDKKNIVENTKNMINEFNDSTKELDKKISQLKNTISVAEEMLKKQIEVTTDKHGIFTQSKEEEKK